MFWQPATLIRGGEGICPTIFLTDCLKTKANLKMEEVNSDSKNSNQKFQKVFFLVNF